MALAIAVFALAAIGAIVAGSLMTGVLEEQSGRNALYLMQAAAAGEGELESLAGSLQAGTLLALPVGGTPLDLGPASPAAGVTVERQISRLAENLFLVRVRGGRVDASGGTLASRTVGLLARIVEDSLSGGNRLVTLPRGWLQLY